MGTKVTHLPDGSVIMEDTGPSPQQKTAADYAGIDSLGSLLDSVPELSHLVDQAISEGWSADKFQNKVEDSKWWRNHSQAARQAIIQRANDPKSWQQTLGNTTSTVQSLAKQLGFNVDKRTAQNIANSALMSGNQTNQDWLTKQLGRHQDYSHVKNVDNFSGNMATTIQQLQSLAADYGFTYSPHTLAAHAQQIVMGNQSIDAYQQDLKQWAKSAFPPLSKAIDSGSTVKDLAMPYVNSMSQLLEVDPGTLNVYTPAIRKAMQGVQVPGANDKEAMPLWQFEDQVRQDPRWQYTQNAKDTMSTALLKIGAAFGFGPGG